MYSHLRLTALLIAVMLPLMGCQIFASKTMASSGQGDTFQVDGRSSASQTVIVEAVDEDGNDFRYYQQLSAAPRGGKNLTQQDMAVSVNPDGSWQLGQSQDADLQTEGLVATIDVLNTTIAKLDELAETLRVLHPLGLVADTSSKIEGYASRAQELKAEKAALEAELEALRALSLPDPPDLEENPNG